MIYFLGEVGAPRGHEENMKNPLSFLIRSRRRKRLTPDGLRITEFPPPVQNLLRLYGVGGSYAQIYASQPNVRTVVDDLAREAAELTLKMYERDPRGRGLPSARIDITNSHRMMQLLEEPMPGESTYRFWFSLFADIGIYDRAIWWKIRDGAGPPKALMRVPPANILPVHDPVTGVVREWRASNGRTIPSSDLVVFWGYDPNVNHGSVSPMETLRRLLAEEHAAGLDREGRWRNSARKDGVIEQHVDAVKMSDEARESFLLDVEDALTGAGGSGRPLMLEPGMVWKDVQWSPKEMEYINARRLSRVEVAAAYHYPPAKIAAALQGQEPDQDTLDFFYTSTLPPYLSRVESEIEAQLLPEFELTRERRRAVYVEFNLDEKLRGSFERKAAIMATTAGGPVVTVNEARTRLNLPPVPGGDALLVPLNSVRGGGPQASPRNPVESQNDPMDLEPAGITPGGGTASMEIEDILAKADDLERRVKQRESHAEFLRSQRVKFDERAKKVLMRHFERQRNALKAYKSLKRERWDRELADDLFGFLYPAVGTIGDDFAQRVTDGSFDHERTANFLREHAKLTAKSINDATEERLSSTTKDAELTDEELDAVYGGDRAERLGGDIATFAIGWGVLEAGRQFGASRLVKTWYTTSRNPRQSHADINGTSAGWNEEFGNGLMYPGDGAQGPEEAANCRCIMTVEEVDV